MTNSIKVTGAIVSRNGITLFSADGQSIVLPSDSYKTSEILAATSFAEIAKNGFVDIDLDSFKLGDKLKELAASTAVKVEPKADGTIAVKTDTVAIADISPIANHIEHRLRSDKGAKGFALFLESFARIPHQHSAEDLLTFLKHADLPIADDGSIVAYKVLNKKKGEPGVFVDCHTNSIPQRLGSRVQMPEDEVNRNRATSCSTGLHICSRRYISGFSGQVLTLVKVKPEDVITVPHGEHTKVRARAYQIVAVLDGESEAHLRSSDSAELSQTGKGWDTLSRVVAGDHPGVLEIVDVVKGKPTVTRVAQAETPDLIPADYAGAITQAVAETAGPTKTTKAKKAKVERVAPLPPKEKTAVAIDPREVRKKIKNDMLKLAEQPAPIGKDAPYEQKFAEAKRRVAAGESLRTVAKALGMCRESLSRNLKSA